MTKGAAMMTRSAAGAGLLLLAALAMPGCLFIRTTEHLITLKEDGSGDARMRLIDIRSDAQSDSLLARDYSVMMASIEKEGIEEFERGGRKVTSKQFFASGDTLTAEITYTFPNLNEVEGLKFHRNEMFVVVNEGREIVKTNGDVQSWLKGAKRIVWPRNAKHLMYLISEKKIPPARSLAPLYLKYGYSLPPSPETH